MKTITLLPADTYTVVNKSILTNEDRKNLIALYEPIIGPIAVALYLTLWNDLDKLELTSDDLNHHHLMAVMKLDLDSLKLARETLESVGLIRTFYKEESVNSYVYELYSPLEPKEFLNHPIFNVVLYNNVGKIEYAKIKSLYQAVNFDTSEYEDISKPINETFKPSNIVPEFDVRKTENLPVNALNIIDFDELVASIPNNILNEKSLNKKVKELINNLAFVYNLDTLKMAEIIRSTINEKGYIVTDDLRKMARNYYSYNNSGKLPTLIYRTQPEYLKAPVGDSSKRARIIYVFENTTPYDFLRSKYKGVKPINHDLKLLEYLTCDLELKPAVVNVLIDYVLRKNDNKLNQSFVETIAGQWKRSGVETAEEAMQLAEKQQKKIIKSAPGNIKNPEATPVWFKKEIQKENVTKEEEEELKELMKGYN
jgi:replication initiation and membrane attachment protein